MNLENNFQYSILNAVINAVIFANCTDQPSKKVVPVLWQGSKGLNCQLTGLRFDSPLLPVTWGPLVTSGLKTVAGRQ